MKKKMMMMKKKKKMEFSYNYEIVLLSCITNEPAFESDLSHLLKYYAPITNSSSFGYSLAAQKYSQIYLKQ
jgi:hypothetical protein